MKSRPTLLLLLWLFLLAAGVIAAAHGVVDYRNSLKLLADGKPVMARVSKVSKPWPFSANAGFRVRIEFRDPTGKVHASLLRVSYQQYVLATKVPVVEAVYLASDPSIAQMGQQPHKDVVRLVIGVVLILTGSAGLVWRRKRQR